MKIELHIIQNFAPSCLNRDDTNSPKDCIFGGVRRARISSQCIKRAIRRSFADEELVPADNLGWRTKRLAEEVGKRLADEGKDQAAAVKAAEVIIEGLGLGLDDKGQTQYLLFLGESGISALTDLCRQQWDTLAELAAKIQQAEKDDKAKDAKKAKKEAQKAIPDEIKDGLPAILDGSTTADLALFGRMLADRPGDNIDAACQVAHALSTHEVEMEMDFYTAVDDLKGSEEDAGAGMMGVVGFNSACFYRYAVIDLDELIANLDGDRELAEKSIEAFVRASVSAVPSGKQNTFAAHNPPDFILAAVRPTGQPLSLANAFARPVRPRKGDDTDLVQSSVNALAEYWSRVARVYGIGDGGDGGDGGDCSYVGLTDPDGDVDGWSKAESFDALVSAVMAAVREEGSS